ncbi:hypothetical protein BC830DRAFT_22104 [Chytriomyces sp. MP71]|nr:hypothetical protein BC830DRAFT_22104 [Chytriomyces sp. MP71]
MAATLANNVKVQSCWLGLPAEQATCGFMSNTSQAVYCNQGNNANTDPCCSLPVGVSYATWVPSKNGFVFPSIAGGSVNSPSGGLSTGAIAGAVVGILFLVIGVCAGGYILYSRYNRQKSAQQKYEEDVVAHMAARQNTSEHVFNSSTYPPPGASQKLQYMTSVEPEYRKPQAPTYSYAQHLSPASQQPPSPSRGANSLSRPQKAGSLPRPPSKPHQQQQQSQPIAVQPVPQQTQKQEIVRIIHAYSSQMPDELDLVEGNDLIVVKRFDDGYR